MSTLIVTSVVVVYAIASMWYVASSEQRATRHRGRDRVAGSRDVELSLPATQPVAAVTAARSAPVWFDDINPGFPEFIRGGFEYESTGPWRRLRSSAALMGLLAVVGAVVAVLLGIAAVVTIVVLKNAAY